MHMTRAHSRICGIAAALLTAAVPVLAQSTAPQTPSATAQQKPAEPSPARTSGESDTRPATTTFEGDTGLWFVPTGEVLPAKKWSLSAYRVNFDRDQGFTDVSNWPVTAGIGLADRAEIFGAFTVVRRIDRDVRPVFVATQPRAGGLANEYPFVRQGWSDNQLGDFTIGAKVNLLSEWRQAPVALAVRAQLKLPTAKDDDEGVGTGKTDFSFDAILSKEINQRVELSGYAGYIMRGDPSGVDLSNGFRWGIGAGLPSRGAAAADGGTPWRALRERHPDADDADHRAGWQHLAARDRPDLAGQCDVRVDVPGAQRLLCRRRDQLEPAHGCAQQFLLRVRQPDGGFERLPDAPRVSPRGARLCAAAAARAGRPRRRRRRSITCR